MSGPPSGKAGLLGGWLTPQCAGFMQDHPNSFASGVLRGFPHLMQGKQQSMAIYSKGLVTHPPPRPRWATVSVPQDIHPAERKTDEPTSSNSNAAGQGACAS